MCVMLRAGSFLPWNADRLDIATFSVAKSIAGLLELIADHVPHRPPSATSEGVRIALRATELSIEKAQRELGYAPQPIEPALRETIAHLMEADVSPTRP